MPAKDKGRSMAPVAVMIWPARMRHKRELSEGSGAVDPAAEEPAAGKLGGPID